MLPVTYYPVATQRQFALNRKRIQGKPYAKYCNGDLWIHDDVEVTVGEGREPSFQVVLHDVQSLLGAGQDCGFVDFDPDQARVSPRTQP